MPQIDSKRTGKRGWFGEPKRHALAAKGIQTGQKIPSRDPNWPENVITKQEQKEVLEQTEELEQKAEELEEKAEEVKEEAEELEEESKELKKEAKDVSEVVEESIE